MKQARSAQLERGGRGRGRREHALSCARAHHSGACPCVPALKPTDKTEFESFSPYYSCGSLHGTAIPCCGGSTV